MLIIQVNYLKFTIMVSRWHYSHPPSQRRFQNLKIFENTLFLPTLPLQWVAQDSSSNTHQNLMETDTLLCPACKGHSGAHHTKHCKCKTLSHRQKHRDTLQVERQKGLSWPVELPSYSAV